MRKVYIIVGTTGEYSDHTQWNVATYIDKDQAQIHLERLNEQIKSLKLDRESNNRPKRSYSDRKQERTKIERTLDPNITVDYTGVSYGIEEVELFQHFDEFQETHNKDLISEG